MKGNGIQAKDLKSCEDNLENTSGNMVSVASCIFNYL